MISETFTDEYGTTITARQLDGWTHVQLLMKYADGTEDTSYGFTPEAFQRFVKLLLRVDEQIVAARFPA